ncbi:unnamed protein product [Mytilus coruscus]|uniref:HTH psq-type domain-containing protein n=1 Tax=Mytilus coruscus TaxID=42192 RepID=A0A6J7ZXC4_MYTCO|nr:unnamed protein product [Mytilus coruscus]
MSQRKAALQFNVPRQNLRDRIISKICSDCVTTGSAPVFSLEEEARIVEHVKSMASYGYWYTRQVVTDLATDFAYTINIKPRNEELTLRGFEGFIKRWPEFKVVKLEDKPHLIFNIDEKGITLKHKPPNVVSGIECNTSSVTSGRSSTTTILGCGSASAFDVPPYFVFEGKRMVNDLMNGATSGAVELLSNDINMSGIFELDMQQNDLEDSFSHLHIESDDTESSIPTLDCTSCLSSVVSSSSFKCFPLDFTNVSTSSFTQLER